MKTIKSFLLAAIIATSSVLSASTEPVTKVEPNLITQEVSELLKNPSFDVEQDLLANVTLTINKNNELVVLSVDSESEQVVNYIKSRLNYHKLSADVDTQTFKIPVRIKAEEN
jgi:hypothetical protein